MIADSRGATVVVRHRFKFKLPLGVPWVRDDLTGIIVPSRLPQSLPL